MTYNIYIYTLLLEDDCYYVGKTRNPKKRKKSHVKGKGSAWTKLHPFVDEISKEAYTVSSKEEEDYYENEQTIKMMLEKGWQKVRGGFWCNCAERETFLALQHHGYFKEIDITKIVFQSVEHVIYILRLEQNKYYAGSSFSLKYAIKKHEKGKASQWTKKYPPIELVHQQSFIYEDGIPNMDIINNLVIEYGEKYGYENIRGGSFTMLDDSKHLKLITSYKQKMSHKI